MKSILCYGDSLTWGYNPADKSRYPFSQRWTGVVQSELGTKVRIIEEALNGRTTVRDDPYLPNRNGREILPIILESHSPLDLVVLMLGSNDLKSYFNLTANEIAMGCFALIRMILRSGTGLNGKSPEVLLIAPPRIIETGGPYELFHKNRSEVSNQLSDCYKKVSESFNCHFLDVSKQVMPSNIDGAHLDIENTILLGKIIAQKIKEIYSLE